MGTGPHSDGIVLSTNGKLVVSLSVLSSYIHQVHFHHWKFLLETTNTVTLSLVLADGVTATEYIISYSSIDCPDDINNDITDIDPSQTMYTLNDLEEGTEYSITVTVTLNGTTETASDTVTTTTLPIG